MTNINATIEAMTRSGTLLGIFGAYSYAALLVAGPWIFTVIGLFYLSSATCEGGCADLVIFRSIVVYNSMYALIVTSPIAFLGGRFVSEQLHSRRDDGIFSVLVLSVIGFSLLSLAIAAPFYFFATTLDASEKVAAVQNAIMIGCSWLFIPFLGAMRSHNTVIAAFGCGAVSMLGLGSMMRDPQAASLLLALNFGFAVINLILLAAVVRRFGAKISFDPALIRNLARNWELAAAGGAYALGLWIDKIIMWHAAPADQLLVAGALQTMPSYDTAMFWAQLSSIPAIAGFFVHVESRLSLLVRAYHQTIQQRAGLRELNQIVASVRDQIVSNMVGLFIVLVLVAGMMIMISLAFMPDLGLRPAYMGILRTALCSMVLYTSSMFCFTFLLHLDLRRPALRIVTTFLVLNALLTWAVLALGPEYYGYGNLIASTVSLLFGFSLVLKELSWLHYHVFITNNSSL